MNKAQNTGFFKFFLQELKPKGKIITPFNIIAAITILAAVVILFFRFKNGLGSVSDASQERPWGLLITLNVITGVAFAGGAYVVTFMVYILGLEKYRPIVRATVLFALLSYIFYAGALLLDLGRPWHIVNPIIGNSFGISAVLFLVAWHFILYMGSLFIEFAPTLSEWAGWKRQRRWFASLTLGVVIFGITLSTLHQSGLGAMFLMAKAKIHPLWYTEFIPIQFFVSSIFAGLSMVIILETINQKVFKRKMLFVHKSTHKPIMISLARICGITMFVYFIINGLVFIHGQNYTYLNTPLGYWYLTEAIGFVLIPCFFFIYAFRHNNLLLTRIAAFISVTGIILNRLNVSTIAYRWYANDLHFPNWMEIVLCVAVIFIQVLVFRWIVRRMPVYTEIPTWVVREKQKITVSTNDKKNKKWKLSVN